jgi:hypothetical protein
MGGRHGRAEKRHERAHASHPAPCRGDVVPSVLGNDRTTDQDKAGPMLASGPPTCCSTVLARSNGSPFLRFAMCLAAVFSSYASERRAKADAPEARSDRVSVLRAAAGCFLPLGRTATEPKPPYTVSQEIRRPTGGARAALPSVEKGGPGACAEPRTGASGLRGNDQPPRTRPF